MNISNIFLSQTGVAMKAKQEPQGSQEFKRTDDIHSLNSGVFDVFLTSTAKMNAAKVRRVDLRKSDVKLPEYIYHLTSKENALKIIKSKKIMMPKTECRTDQTYDPESQLRGIYTIDKDNFMNKWQEADKYNVTGEILKLIANSSNDIAIIKIPTSKLDKTKMKIRPIHETTINSDYIKGFPIEKLNEWNNSALEYVYQDEIPVDSFDSVEYKNFNLPMVYDERAKKDIPDFSSIRNSPEKTRELMEIIFSK